LAESPRTTERDSEEILLDHLESRRGELAEAQWHAPGLVIAAQAFLLQVLTDASVAGSVRAAILAAGVTACVAALLSLLRLRQREVRYSEVLAEYGPDLRAQRLPDGKRLLLPGPSGWLDRRLQRLAGRDYWPNVHLWWSAALIAFIVADFFAYFVTN
jgi:hypothetical protein